MKNLKLLGAILWVGKIDGYFSDNNFTLYVGGGTTIVYDTNLKVVHNITP